MKPTATTIQNQLRHLSQRTVDLPARTRTRPHSGVMRLPQQNSWCRPSHFWPALLSSTSLTLPDFQIVRSSSNSHHFLLSTSFPLGGNYMRSPLGDFCGLWKMRNVYTRACISGNAAIHKFLWKALFQLQHGVLHFMQSVGLLQNITLCLFLPLLKETEYTARIRCLLSCVHNPNVGNKVFQFEYGHFIKHALDCQCIHCHQSPLEFHVLLCNSEKPENGRYQCMLCFESELHANVA